jgi:predicted unusual protein kinase regulating ubiquinone biosynthesis (AarF/ABC1/UbiB family)
MSHLGFESGKNPEKNASSKDGLGRGPEKPRPFEFDVKRFRKVRRFFAKVFLHVLFMDILLSFPVLRFFRTDPVPRWRKIAVKFRSLALEMGGVLIKLGQFLSIRVDILPPEVTRELAGLQDAVPPENPDDVIRQIETDFGRPIDEIFARFYGEPLGAASLAQAHRVVLRSGEPAVVKVLRPRIHVLVETDLAAIGMAFRWLKLYKRVRARIDLDWLADEFSSVTRRELDLVSEGRNAERLARDFKNDPDVYIPRIHWDYCGPRTLTMEKVDYIKITDIDAIGAAGISNAKAADKLYRIYMRQVFETFFVHVDPHPGNLFVKPLPAKEELEAGIRDFAPGDPVPYKPDRSFQIVFVDFGMAVEIPERLRAALREYAIGIGTRDARKMVRAYVSAGAFPASENTDRLEQAHEALFDRLWGVRVGQFRSLAVSEARYFLKEFRDVIYDAPFQFQADMLFVVRSVGILSGLATHLDPEFDPWAKTIPYAERFAKARLRQGWMEWQKEIEAVSHQILNLPGRMDRTLDLAAKGKLTVRYSFTPEADKRIQGLEKAIRRIGWTIVSATFFLSGMFCPERVCDDAIRTILMVSAGLFFLLVLKK